jgi:excisionase family DNA binding protein
MNYSTHIERVADSTTDELLDKREVGAKLKRGRRTVEKWMREGQLPYFKIGGTVRFRWGDVLKKLEKYRIN